MARGLRMARGWRLAPAAACALLIAGPAGQAGAVPPNAAEPAWPSVNGPVRAVALSGGRLYIGGSFSQVGGQAHANVAALDAATGAVDPGFTAGTDGSVDALAVSGSRLYLGGMFRRVNSPTENRIRVAAVDTATGNLDSGFVSPFTQGVPRALAVSGARLYVGGLDLVTSGSCPGATCRNLWALNVASGAVDSGFGAQPDDRVRALLPSAAGLYVAGAFANVGATARRGVASVDAASGVVDSGFNASADGDVYALALAGSRLYLGGTFAHVGGPQRAGLAAVNAGTGAVDPAWVADTDHAILALAAADPRLYAGGAPGSFGAAGVHSLVAPRLDTGVLSPDFGPSFGVSPVRALAASNVLLYAAGDFGIATFRFLAPVNASAPFITGNPLELAAVSCSPGVWRNDPTGFGFQWLRNGAPIPGATGTTYAVTAADTGRNVACRVTASSSIGTGTADSAPVFPAGALDRTPPAIRIFSGSLRMTRRGVVAVRLACPASEFRCSGTVLLQPLARSRTAAVRGTPLLALSAFGLGGGRTATVNLRLSATDRRLVKRRRRLRVKVTVNARDAAGNAARLSRVVQLRAK